MDENRVSEMLEESFAILKDMLIDQQKERARRRESFDRLNRLEERRLEREIKKLDLEINKLEQ